MPIYEFRNTKTDEVHTEMLKISQLDEYKAKNPDIKQIHTRAPTTISGTKSASQLAGGEWNDHMKRIKESSGKGNTIKV